MPLDGAGWAICIIIGSVSIPVGIVTRFLPPFDFVNTYIIGNYEAKVMPSEADPEPAAGQTTKGGDSDGATKGGGEADGASKK